jgi:O-antigen/teichoic acid export membrane protein
MVHFVVMADLTTLVSSAIKQVDLLLVGAFAGPSEAGYYRLAKSLTAPAGNVGAPIQTVLYPKLARAESQRDFAAADRITRRTVLLVCLPLAVAALCSIPLVHPIIVLLAGTAYTDATAPAIALVAGVAVSFATLHLRPVFLARDKLAALLALTVGPSLAVLVAMVPAADSQGATGVAWTRSAAVALGSLLMLLYIHSRRGRHSGHAADANNPKVIATESPL